MTRAPSEFRDFPDPLARITRLGGCPYGPYRAISRFDPRWDDGDTSLVMLDVGADQYPIQAVRFLGINAPEKNTPEGKQLQADMYDYLMPPGTPLAVVTSWEGQGFGRDKYGRLLGILFRWNPVRGTSGIVCINTDLRDTTAVRAYLEWDLTKAIAESVARWVGP